MGRPSKDDRQYLSVFKYRLLSLRIREEPEAFFWLSFLDRMNKINKMLTKPDGYVLQNALSVIKLSENSV